MIKIIGFIFMAISFIGVMWIAFKFPEMTERQLIIAYWKQYLVCVIFMFIGFRIVDKHES